MKFSDEVLAKRIKQAGLRLTPQRLAIYRAILETHNHPTASALYEQLAGELPSLSPATVYNTLQVFVERGLVHDIGDAGDGVIHYDGDLAPHINLVCLRCHEIEDLHDPSLFQLNGLVARQTGFTVSGARLVYYGLCQQCQADARAA